MKRAVGHPTRVDVVHANNFVEGRTDAKTFIRCMYNNNNIDEEEMLIITSMSDVINRQPMSTDDVHFLSGKNTGTIQKKKMHVIRLLMQLADVTEATAYRMLGLKRIPHTGRIRKLRRESGAEEFTNLIDWLNTHDDKYVIDGARNLWTREKMLKVFSNDVDDRKTSKAYESTYAVFEKRIVYVHDRFGDVLEKPGTPFHDLTLARTRARWNHMYEVRSRYAGSTQKA